MVVSKCGLPRPRGAWNKSLNVKVIELPNVGRCDHSFAWALSNMTRVFGETPGDKDVIFFGKDNVRGHQPGWRPHNVTNHTSISDLQDNFNSMLADAHQSGFACWLRPAPPSPGHPTVTD